MLFFFLFTTLLRKLWCAREIRANNPLELSTLLELVHYTCTELWAIMSYNKSYFADLSFDELNDFSPNLKGWRRYFFIGVSMITIILALIVQKAIYKSLKNLGPRPINKMIIPSQVCIFYSNYVFSLMKHISNVVHIYNACQDLGFMWKLRSCKFR